MSASRLTYLFNRYVQQQCTVIEEKELMALLAEPRNREAVHSLIQVVINDTGAEMDMTDNKAASILDYIVSQNHGVVLPMKRESTGTFFWRRLAAAVLIFFMAGAVYWYVYKREDGTVKSVVQKPSPILPGRNTAVLTMADGTTVVLDQTEDGVITQPGNINIKKRGASLIYDAPASGHDKAKVAFNTMSTPRGGQYHLILPDGSNVWLNSASSLHYPIMFTGMQREVELTGEAYFEIAGKRERPFIVNVNGMKVEVLGTNFNVNAYNDEAIIRTSLLSGSVKVVKGAMASVLEPGQQAQLDTRSSKLKTVSVDMDDVIAWKNGVFHFGGDDIASIMRQIGRWYDVEIVYPDEMPVRHFEGKISRGAKLSDVLQILELSGVKFVVQGKRIIIQ